MKQRKLLGIISVLVLLFINTMMVTAQQGNLDNETERQLWVYIDLMVRTNEASSFVANEHGLTTFSVPIKDEERGLLNKIIQHLENGGYIWIGGNSIIWDVTYDNENNQLIITDSGT